MKKLLPALALAALFAVPASADAIDEAAMMANGTPAGAVMDGSKNGGTGGDTTPSGRGSMKAQNAGPGQASAKTRSAAPAAPAQKKGAPGLLSKAWDYVKSPGFYLPAGMALVGGAMGFMMAGPLGAVTVAAICGLLGLIFSKAMGG